MWYRLGAETEHLAFIPADEFVTFVIASRESIGAIHPNCSSRMFQWRETFPSYWRYIIPEVVRFLGASWDHGAPWVKFGKLEWAVPGEHAANLMRLIQEDAPDIQPLDVVLAAFPFVGFPLPASMRNAIHAWSSRHPVEWSMLYPAITIFLGPEWPYSSAMEATDTQISVEGVKKEEQQ